ncbi:MAG: RagB/SusD family nutrient uptake outer membrane protein [Bacteroidota bacterium]
MIKRIFILALLPFLLTTCSKEFLELDPLVGSTEANFYATAGDAEAAIISCYNPLQQEVTPIQGSSLLAPHFRWYFGDVCSDDSFKGGSGDGDEPELFLFENFQGNSSSKLTLGEWQSHYRAIAYCNIALEKIPDIDMDQDLQNRFLGEASFIRAYSYYNLVIVFGGVPLVTTSLSPSEYQQPRATEAEIWAQIESDLQSARNALPRKSELSLGELGRATWGAASSLLGKAHMFQQDYQAARDILLEVINSGEYFLDPSYENVFSLAGENGPGSIWEIQYMNASGGNWGNQLEGTFTNVFQRARGAFNGFGFNIPTQDFVDEFESGDPRLRATVFQEGDQMGDRGVFTLDATGFPHIYYPRKYFLNAADEAPFGDVNPNGPANDRVLRYADVLLLYAEASFQLGLEQDARDAVNEVRERARGGFGGILPDVNAGGPFLLQAIYHERRVELGLEGHRFFDLVRQGRAAEIMQGQGLSFVEGVHEIFPIPEVEITLSGGAITQNPGY